MYEVLHTLNPLCWILIYLTYSSQIFTYIFLIERVHIVSFAGQKPPRLSTGIYKFGLAAICVYIVIFALMIHGRVVELATPSWFLESQPELHLLPKPLPAVCTIGLKVYATIPLLVYDVVASIALTVMFIVPLITVGRVEPHSAGVGRGIISPEATLPHAQDNPNAPATVGSRPLPFPEKLRASSTRNAAEGMENQSFWPRWGRVHRSRLRSLAKKSCL